MDGGNVETVRKLHEAWNEDDTDRMLELIDEGFEYVNPPYAVEGGMKRGHAGFEEVMENLRSSFESYRHDPEEILDRGDHVIVRSRFTARGRGSGVDVERKRFHVWKLRNGKATRLQWFDTLEESEEAAKRG
jgi:ketosteroid isomerase-like protein